MLHTGAVSTYWWWIANKSEGDFVLVVDTLNSYAIDAGHCFYLAEEADKLFWQIICNITQALWESLGALPVCNSLMRLRLSLCCPFSFTVMSSGMCLAYTDCVILLIMALALGLITFENLSSTCESRWTSMREPDLYKELLYWHEIAQLSLMVQSLDVTMWTQLAWRSYLSKSCAA